MFVDVSKNFFPVGNQEEPFLLYPQSTKTILSLYKILTLNDMVGWGVGETTTK